MQPGERQLITRYLANDPAAIAQIEQWIVGASLSYRQRLNADWEDAHSETHLKLVIVFRNETFRGESKLKTFVAIVTSHTCLDLLRQKARRPLENLDDFPDLVGPMESPEEELVWSEICLRVWVQMSEKCQQAVALILEEWSYAEMSRELQELPGTLRRRVHDCHRQAVALRDRLLTQKKGAAA